MQFGNRQNYISFTSCCNTDSYVAFFYIDQRTTAMVSADFTCNGPCIQGNTTSGASSEILDANRQLLMDTIAKEWTISTTFGDGRVRIIYFKRGQQSTITAVCGTSAAEDNLCSESHKS